MSLIYLGQTFSTTPIIQGSILVPVFECTICKSRQTLDSKECHECKRIELDFENSSEYAEFVEEEKTK